MGLPMIRNVLSAVAIAWAALSVGAAQAASPSSSVERPSAPTVGVGIGSSLEPWVLSHAVVAVPIDRGGLRIRVTDRFTVAPSFVHSRWEHDWPTDTSEDATHKYTHQEVQGAVRWVAGSRGPMDLVVFGGGSMGRSLTQALPKTRHEASFYESWLSLHGGLGVEAFIRPQWSVGLDAEMKLYSSERAQSSVEEARDLELHLGWKPGVVTSTSLYF